MLKALPHPALESLARDSTRRFGMLDVPESWVELSATLIPKIAAAHELKIFRPVSSLTAIRKLWGYVWMELLPDLRFKTLQTAFVNCVDAAQGFTQSRGLPNSHGNGTAQSSLSKLT